MRLIKLKLCNWRGVENREIEFSAGVTLIEGPNEVGKSTIIEAIQNLFTVMDSSGRADIKAIQPVGRDVGSTVEAEIEVADYHFIYTKTYNRNKQTELRLLAPRHAQYTGREAHEQVEQILEESVDMALWNALLVEQGGELAGVSLAQSDGLARALDEVAGGEARDQDDSDLFARVERHYEQYFSTKTGKPKAWQSTLEDQLDQARSAETAAVAAMQELEADIASHERSRSEIARIEAALPELQRELQKNEASWLAVGKIREQMHSREREILAAAELLKAATEDLARRNRLIDALAASAAKQKALSEALQPQAQALDSLEAATHAAKKLLDDARADSATLQSMAELRRNDVEHLQARAQLNSLAEKLKLIRDASSQRKLLREALQQVRINPDALNALRDAQREVEMAVARLDTATSSITIEAEADVTLLLDDDAVELSSGEVEQRSISAETRLRLPGIASIQVTPSQSASDLETELLDRQGTLARLLSQYQVADLAEAVAVEERRAANEQETRTWNAKIDDLLNGETVEELQIVSNDLAASTQNYLAAREAGAALPDTIETARALSNTAADESARSQAKVENLRNAWEESRDAYAEAKGQFRVAEQEAAGETRINAHQQKDLNDARAAETDQAIECRVAEKTATVESLQADLLALQKQLAISSPEVAEQLFENSRAACERAEQELAASRTDRAVMSDRLTKARADGRFETLESATRHREAIEDELSVTASRAAAAQRLWRVLNRHRDQARSAYVRPLKEHVEQFGRIVFGADFEIELGENWELRSRTLNGQTIPFADLSVGAREQLGILLRLAAARIVSSQGGVPLIIDDALGFSDPDRLKTMAAAIASAGRDCQVIVLTCSPGRFTHVGNAKVVNL